MFQVKPKIALVFFLSMTFFVWFSYAQQATTTASPKKTEKKSKKKSKKTEPVVEAPAESKISSIDPTTMNYDSMPFVLPQDSKVKLSPEVQAIRDAIDIRWFQPQSFPDVEKNMVRVVLAGLTKQGTKIYLKTDEIIHFKNSSEIETKKLTNEDIRFLPGVADQPGIFGFELNLPPGKYQLSVAAVDNQAQTMVAAKIYVIYLKITLKGVEFGFVLEGEDEPFVPQSDFVSFGLGANYAIFNKQVPAIPAEIRFSSFKLPNIRAGYAKTWNREWRIHASLSASPGETTTGTRIPVEGGTYLWTIVSGDGIYSHEDWKLEYGNYKMRYAIRGGLQAHSVPFIQSVSTQDTTQGLANVTYMAPTIGGHIDVMTDYGFSYEVFARLGIPFINYSSIKTSDNLLLDGSIGARYRIKGDPWSYGVYWTGQWLKYKFNEDDKFMQTNVDGSFDILNSNIEFRIHYHF